MYVGNSPPNSSVTPISQAQIDRENAKLIPMGAAIERAMQWPCFAPSPPFDPTQFGPAVIADASLMQSLVASTSATSAAASAGIVQAADTSDSAAPTVIPLNPYDFQTATPTQTPQSARSCPSRSQNLSAPMWGGASVVPVSSGLFGGMNAWLLAGLAALGLYGWSRVK